MIDVLKPLIQQFMPFAQEKMGFSRPPKLFLRQDAQNAANPLGKTGFYDPQAESITLYTSGRHPKDIMRSLAHELQHHTQKCNGEFDKSNNLGEEGYAQNDPHLRTMEIEAYQASIVFRDWEDSIKGTIYNEHLQKGDNSKMSTKDWKNGELTTLLSESFGFGFKVDKLNEGSDQDGEEGAKKDVAGKASGWNDPEHQEQELKEDSGEEEAWHQWMNEHADDDHIREIEHHLRALKHDRDHERDEAEYDDDRYEDEGDPSLEEASGDRGDDDRSRGEARKGPSSGGAAATAESKIRDLVREALAKALQNAKTTKGK